MSATQSGTKLNSNKMPCCVGLAARNFGNGRVVLCAWETIKGRMKKVRLFSNWHGGVMVKAVVYVAHGGVDRFPAGPRALLGWFQSGRNRSGSCCNRFEELDK